MTITNNTNVMAYEGAIKGLRYYDGVLSEIQATDSVDSVLLDTDLAWKMRKEQILTPNPDGVSDPTVSERHAAVWATHELTGEQQFTESIVGKDSFTFTQNRPIVEAFMEVAATGLITPTMGGSLDKHTKAFMHFTVGEDYTIRTDLHRKGLLVAWGHDGSAALTLRPVVHRIQCMNQVNAFGRFRRGESALFTIRHTKSALPKMETLTSTIVEAIATLDGYDRMMRELMDIKILDAEFDRYLQELLPIDAKIANSPEHLLSTGEKRSRTIVENKRAAVRDVYYNSDTQSDLRDTAAGAFHAAVEAFDHRFSGNRGRRLLTGADEQFKARAADLALAF